ncbi:MAG: hypothetical protein JSV39_04725 [Candidatus Aenigmatarchaeota archaeon]|nr:MAG: hypothetical protein JSV39_04725 [Candidatus Aenigmarchaeota archaeon]
MLDKIELYKKSRLTLEFVHLFEYIKSVSKIIGEKKAWEIMKKNITKRRSRWLKENIEKISPEYSELETARQVLILKLGVDPKELNVIERKSDKIVIKSDNFCPILTACEILGWSPKKICKLVCEGAAREFMSEVNPKLAFKFTKTRPVSRYCEEVISLK